MKKLIFVLLVISPLFSNAQSPFYGVSPFDGVLKTINPTTYAETSTTMTSSLGTVSGANGLASWNCVVHIVYKVNSQRRLGTINVGTGVITDIGLFSDNVANIAFDNNGVLYAVTGDGAINPETLYTVNQTNAALTFLATLGNGNDGESIEFCPDNNKMYHWSGYGAGNVIMETVDLITGATTSISTSVSGLSNVGASTYAGNGVFIVGDISAGGIKTVDTSGVVTTTSNTNSFKGFAFASSGSVPTVNIVNSTNTTNSICSGDSVNLVCTYTSASYEWFLNGVSTGQTTSSIYATVSGTYVCQVPGPICGTVSSNSISLTVVTAPNVVLAPSGTQNYCSGDSLQLFSSPASAMNQWYLNGNIIPGATNGTIYISTPGVYNVLKTNATGCADSAAVGVIVNSATSPNVTLTPNPSAVICGSGSVQLNVNTGGGNIQWTKNGLNIPGATANSYAATSVGIYNVIKTNMSMCSDSATIGTTVTQSTIPVVSITPSPLVTFCSPATVTLTASSGGGTSQWYKDGVIIPGATGNTYAVLDQGVYNVLKTNMNGCSDSSAVATFADDTCALDLIDLNNDVHFEVFPNPASQSVSVQLVNINKADVISITILSVDGKTVLETELKEILKKSSPINVSSLSKGTYLVRLTTKQGTSVKELLVR